MADRDRDYGDCEEIVEAVMEMIGKRWTKSMIKRELRDWFPGLSASSAQWIITQAKRLICKIYNIDPQEYKGKQIAFYESVIRGGDKTKDKLTAAERLDKLFGLEHITIEDPAAIAEKIIAFKKQAEATVGGQTNNGENKNEGSRKVDTGTVLPSGRDSVKQNVQEEAERENKFNGSQEKEKEKEKSDNVISKEDGLEDVTPKDPEIKANINDVLKKQKDPKAKRSE